MLIRYSAIIGAAKIVWFHGSADGVSTAAAMKISRIASLKCRHRKRAVTSRIFREEQHDRRDLKDHDHPEDHVHVQIEGVLEAGHEAQAARTERREKRHHRREHHVVREEHAAERAEGRQRQERHDELLFFRVTRAR